MKMEPETEDDSKFVINEFAPEFLPVPDTGNDVLIEKIKAITALSKGWFAELNVLPFIRNTERVELIKRLDTLTLMLREINPC